MQSFGVTIRRMKLWDLAAAEDDRRFSPYCWRIKMALRHKGLEAEEIPWRFTEKAELALSGQGAVPVIEDRGRVVHDSWSIALYLDEAYPARPLFDSAGAGDVAGAPARTRRPGLRLARAHARPLRRLRPQGHGLPGLDLSEARIR